MGAAVKDSGAVIRLRLRPPVSLFISANIARRNDGAVHASALVAAADCAFLSASGIRICPPYSGRLDGMGHLSKQSSRILPLLMVRGRYLPRFAPKDSIIELLVPPMRKTGRVVNPISLVSVASGAGFMFFCLRPIESVACKRLHSTLRASERFPFAGNHVFFAIARYANSRKTKFSTANTVRYTGIIPMPTYCWIKPKAVGIKVLPI